MREWRLSANDPMAPRIAADARSGRTVYNDDQVWQLRLGEPDQAAIGFETRYGGRVGLARLVPIWMIGRRQVFETQGYHEPPVLTAFSTDYLRIRAGLTFALRVVVDFWVMESQAVGGRITVENTGDHAETVRLDLTVQAMREQQAMQIYFLTLDNNNVALQMGRLENFQPVLMMEDAATSATQARLSRALELPPGERLATRFVLAALPERDESLALAYKWLSEPIWDAYFTEIDERSAAEPQIETGDPDWDAALAWSQQLVMRSFLAATGSLPHPSFVSSRKTMEGYPASGVHTAGFNSQWGGQSVPEALLIAAPVALAAPDLAKGMVRNFLAVQREDGWIDARPGLGGQRVNVLAPPLLATLAYTVYHYTQDEEFLAECFDGLLAFFDRWFRSDMDRNNDGLPEWTTVHQGAFSDSPTLAQSQRWAQGVDVQTVQAPDLAAYLAREARILVRIAQIIGRDDIAAELQPHMETLANTLNEMWDNEAGIFHYRDRDTHAWPRGETVFEQKGDQSLGEKITLDQPSRLILRVIGGLSRKPNLSCTLEGIDGSGKHTHEEIETKGFDWYRGMGSATTSTVWQTLTHVKFSGLSRVFTVRGHTVDLTRHDQSLFMPLWAGTLTPDQITRTVALLTDPERYWHEYGVTACPRTDPDFDPGHGAGCGGVWPAWNARIAWGLLTQGCRSEAADLFRRLLRAQIQSLREQRTLRTLYHAETGEGLGEVETLESAVSVGWFARLFGGFALDPATAVIAEPYAFEGQTITWTQYGVRIQRSDSGTEITFPSGHTASLPADAKGQIVRDPKAQQKSTKTRRRRHQDDDLLPDGT